MKTKRCKIGVLLLLLLLPGCSRQPVEAQVYAMDTLMTIKLWGSHGETAVQDLSRLFQEQEAQLRQLVLGHYRELLASKA